jgi:hypothetical protein
MTKLLIRLGLLGLALLCLAPRPNAAVPDRGIDAGEFRAPRADIAAFWFWNGDMQPGEMERQLRAMKQSGITAVVFLPHFGIGGQFGRGEVEYYLSETYFERVKFGLETCRRLGLEVILYDEYNWPSGYGGGRVLGGGRVGSRSVPPNPELIAKHLAMVEVPAASRAQEDSWQVPEGKLVAALAVPPGGVSPARDLTAQVVQGHLKWRAPDGGWRLMFFMQRDTLSRSGPGSNPREDVACCPDLLNPAAVDKFISITHEEYYRRFPDYFGTTIVAVFTDEPGFQNNRIDGYLSGTVPWTEALPRAFERKKGYSLLTALPLLWAEEGEAGARVRKDFWDVVSTLYMETYFRKIYDWCRAHRVESIGHVLEDTLRFHRTFEGGDYFKTMRYMHRAGVDQIISRRFGLINPKLGSSAARLFGVPHALSETFGAYGWGLTLEEMKAVVNWHALSGIDAQILHGFYYSIEGERRQEAPPDLFYHQLWRDHFHRFVEHASRMLYLAGRGRQVADVAVLYPTSALMTEGGLTNFAPLAVVEEYFLTVSMAIRAGQYDFNYVDELAVAGDPEVGVAVDIAGKQLQVGDSRYAVMVLPGVPSISGAAAKRLETFHRRGGTVIAVGRLPSKATDGDADAVAGFLRSVFGTVEAGPGPRIERTNAAGGRGVFIPVAGMPSAVELMRDRRAPGLPTSISQGRDLDFDQRWIHDLVAVLDSAAHRDVKTGRLQPSLSFLHKRAAGKDWYLVGNDSTETIREDLWVSRAGVPSIWDPETGRVSIAPVFRRESGGTVVPLELLPYGAAALVFDAAQPVKDPPHVTHSNAEVMASEVVGGSLRVALLADVKRTLSVTAAVRGRTLTRTFEQNEELAPLDVGGEWLFRREGAEQAEIPRALGSWTDRWPDFSGTAWYAKQVRVDGSWLASGRRVYLDLGVVKNIATVRVNGSDAGTRLWSPYRFEITTSLQPGENRLEIGVTNTLANRYGPGRADLPQTPPSGLLGPVKMIPARVLNAEFAPDR